MTKKVLTTSAIICLSLGSLIGGKGKGPGKPPNEVPAQFVLPNSPTGTSAELLGDGTTGNSVYRNEDVQPGVAAYFMGSGNPKLELAETSDRWLVIKPQGTCTWLDELSDGQGDVVVNGDAMWFANLSSSPDEYGGLPGDLCSGFDVNGDPQQCFLTMALNSIGFSMMPLRFTATVDGTDYLYRVLLGKSATADLADPREPVVVTRTGSDSWNISGIDSGVSVGSVSRKTLKKGKASWEILGNCSFYIDYDICTADAASCGTE